jgi:ribonuclease-3
VQRLPDDEFERISQRLGYTFSDHGLLRRALTHASSARQRADYERLEFLGDRVLGLVIAEELYRRDPNRREGELAARFSVLVRGETCAAVARQAGLGEHVRMGRRESAEGIHLNVSVLGDVMEALIAAVYLDGGIEPARRMILSLWEPLIQSQAFHRKDSKTYLQEWALANALAIPGYRLVSQEGPHHAPSFAVEVQVHGRAGAVGQGPTKRAAEQAAATAFLEREGIRRGS